MRGRYSNEETRIVCSAWERGVRVEEIAAVLGRSKWSVYGRLRYLGVS